MSRLDRLVRTAGAHMDDDENLLGSVLGRLAASRAHVALVATDRQLLVVRDHLSRDTVERHPYGDVTAFEREDAPGALAVEVVTTAGRVRIERIADTAEARVALRLMARRVEANDATTLRTAGGPAGAPPATPARVRIVS